MEHITGDDMKLLMVLDAQCVRDLVEVRPIGPGPQSLL